MQLSGKGFILGLCLPLLLGILITPWLNTIDLAMTRFFYHDSSFSSFFLWQFIYEYGTWPGWVAIIFACGGLFFSFFIPTYRKWRLPSLYFILTLAIGSGLIIHAGLKDQWGRPRPRQVIEFGGQQPFRPYYSPQFHSQPEPSKSFACGHCTMGFCFFALAMIGYYAQRRWLILLGGLLAWSLGILLSVARVAQGGHFFSDILASLCIMWWTAWILAYFLLSKTQEQIIVI